MPKRFRRKGRRRGRKRRRFRKKRKFSPFNIVGMPKKYFVTLVYGDQKTLDSGGAPLTLRYSTNSLFDPDFETGGHQPRYFNTFASLYDRYVVLGARIEVTATTTDATTSSLIGIKVNPDSTFASTVVVDYLEDPNFKFRMMTNANGGLNIAKVIAHWSLKKWTGTKGIMGSSQYQAAVTASPGTQHLFHVTTIPATPVDVTAVHYTVRIYYRCMFFNLDLVAAS